MTNFPEQQARACAKSVVNLEEILRKNVKVIKVTFWEMTNGET
jgi:hypothetical protein